MSDILVVLGAGATRGEERLGPRICEPPLNHDFFIQLQKCASTYPELVGKIIKDVIALYGANFDLTLEDLFTQIEFLIRVQHLTKKKSKTFRVENLKAFKNNLLQAIAVVFHESVADQKTYRYHDALVNLLPKSSTIISMNYDCLIDSALQKGGNSKWNASYGYAIPKREYEIMGDGDWSPKDPSTEKDTTHLLKLHGSMNWKISKNKSYDDKKNYSKKNRRGVVQLKTHPYWASAKRSAHFDIVPPEWQKSLESPPYAAIWKEAAIKIHAARKIICIGFSFPWTDLHTSSLFRASLRRDISLLVQVEPDRTARRRTRQIFAPGITNKTTILTYGTFEEFHNAVQSSEDLQEFIFGMKIAGSVARAYGSVEQQLTRQELKEVEGVQQDG